jgi:predicted dehydrogenase
MSERIRIAVAGGGLIAQVEHLPNLLALRRRFELVAVSDPSATVRAAIAERFGVPVVANAEMLLDRPLDALLIAAPDPWHGALVARAIEAGLHVFCEKPLCYGPAEIDALIAARDAADKSVVQVGYMKRFDPAYEAALALVAERRGALRSVAVEVNDPDAWPFVAHQPPVVGQDVPVTLREATAARRREQAALALGFDPDPETLAGFCGPLSSALVHDVNAVHGLLDAAGVATGAVKGAAIFAGGSSAQAAVALDDGRALWSLIYTDMPGIAEYSERITLAFEDGAISLAFSSPYLNHHPTRLVTVGSRSHRREAVDIRPGYGEAFVAELEGFADAIEGKAPVRNPMEQARRDQALLVEMAIKAAGRG